jgi:hypothetical protein
VTLIAMILDKFKQIENRVEDWRRKHELFAGLITFTLMALFMFFTDDGNRLRETAVGAIFFWSSVVLIALSGILLLVKHGLFYHIFMLSLIAYLYFSKEDKAASFWVAIFYGASIFLPALWQVLSDDLAEKVVRKLKDRSKDKKDIFE